MYSNNGVQITHSGTLIFKGRCLIGNNSFIYTGSDGGIEFCDEFITSFSLKIISICGICFGRQTSVGWRTVIQDSKFHPIFDRKLLSDRKAYGKIEIGDNEVI